MSVSDTVGFIRDLPHKLVEAFEATLQEATDADLLLHVIDAASPLRDEQIADVDRVLREIGADVLPQVLVYNKLDRFEPSNRPREMRDEIDMGGGVRRTRVFVSARDGEGIDALRAVIAEAATGASAQGPAGGLNGEPAASPAMDDGIAGAVEDNPPAANHH